MKKSSVNTFTEGLVCDLDPINVPNNVLTDCLNGTIITYDGNEYSLQNDKGNYPLKDCKLDENYIPIGIKEYNGILYIASINPLTGDEELGCYPSPKELLGFEVTSGLDFDLVINKAFEDSNTNNIDYSDIESQQKTACYSDPKMKINVGDKFWFNDLSANNLFERVEHYIIDENSNPHIVSQDWLDSDSKYVSPVSGTMFLENKIFKIEDSSAETNSFINWKNNNNYYRKINEESEDYSGKYVIGYVSANTVYTLSKTSEVIGVNNDIISEISAINVELILEKNSDGSYYIKQGNDYLVYIKSDSIGFTWDAKDDNDDYYKWLVKKHDFEDGKSVLVIYSQDQEYHFAANNGVALVSSNAIGGPPPATLFKKVEVDGVESLLFSFTYKLYIENLETINWLGDLSKLAYKVILKQNDKSIYEGLAVDFNDSTNDLSLTSEKSLWLEWFGNSKIITKRFTCILSGVSLNDSITAEITPVINFESNKTISISKLNKKLNNSVSEYVSQEWSIGKSSYKFYNTPDIQYIEFDIEGPAETNDDVSITLDIRDLENNSVMTKSVNSGIGRVKLEIPYSNSFEKEDVYNVTYSINVASQPIYQITKKLITSEIFNDESLSLTYNDYSGIPESTIFQLYLKTIKKSFISDYSFVEGENDQNLPRTKRNYKQGTNYFEDDVKYSSFITNSAHYNEGDELLSGIRKEIVIDVESPITLTGNMWTISESKNLVDGLGGVHTYKKDSSYKIPLGFSMPIFTKAGTVDIVGKIDSIGLITTPNSKTVNLNYSHPTLTIRVDDDQKFVHNFTPGANQTDTISMENVFNQLFNGSAVNLSFTTNNLSFNGSSQYGNLQLETAQVDLQGGPAVYSESGGYYVLDTNHYVVNCSNPSEKYSKGKWCIIESAGSSSKINTIDVKCTLTIKIKGFNNTYREEISEKLIINEGIPEDTCQTMIDDINLRTTNDKAEFNAYKEQYPGFVTEGYYVKGVIVNSGSKYSYNCLSNTFRTQNKFIFPKRSDSELVYSWIALTTMRNGSVIAQDTLRFVWKEGAIVNKCISANNE